MDTTNIGTNTGTGINTNTDTMNLGETVDMALATYGMSRSEEAEETGRTVATLQD